MIRLLLPALVLFVFSQGLAAATIAEQREVSRLACNYHPHTDICKAMVASAKDAALGKVFANACDLLASHVNLDRAEQLEKSCRVETIPNKRLMEWIRDSRQQDDLYAIGRKLGLGGELSSAFARCYPQLRDESFARACAVVLVFNAQQQKPTEYLEALVQAAGCALPERTTTLPDACK